MLLVRQVHVILLSTTLIRARPLVCQAGHCIAMAYPYQVFMYRTAGGKHLRYSNEGGGTAAASSSASELESPPS
jgi:hypothetical protein